MSSSDSLRNSIYRILTPAADEIFARCVETVANYEEDLRRQRALLDVAFKAEKQPDTLLLPQYHLTDQDRNPDATLLKAEPSGSPEPK